MADHYHELRRPSEVVTVRVGDEVLARSEHTMLLQEVVGDRRLGPVYYFPPEDVAVELLEAAETSSHCPIKGEASYWSYDDGEARESDLVWSYVDPFDYSRDIAGWMAFDARRVTIEVV